MRERGNRLVAGIPKDLLIALLVLSASTASFGLGVLSGRDMNSKGREDSFHIETTSTTTGALLGASALIATQQTLPATSVRQPNAPATSGAYVASKTGTKYYLPTCSGAKRIKDSNRVWFSSKADAQASGRTAASHCPGL